MSGRVCAALLLLAWGALWAVLMLPTAPTVARALLGSPVVHAVGLIGAPVALWVALMRWRWSEVFR